LNLRIRLALLVAPAIVLSACTVSNEPVVVWSNVAETAFLVERYNFIHDADVRFRFVENLTESLTQERPEADVIIGRWVNTPPVNALMREYEGYLSTAADVPPVNAGPHWIPLSFNLPTIASLPETADQLPRFSVSLDDLSALYTSQTPPLHFAPTADSQAVYALHRSLGFLAGVDDQGTPTWDEQSLSLAISRIRDWQQEYNGGLARERDYIERYLYERPFQQLQKERISVVYFGSEELFSWRFFDERNMSFRWLSSADGELRANENVVYGGVPATADHITEAGRFLTWAIDPETQVSIMRSKFEARIDSFGFLEGFALHESVNRRLEEEIYPELSGRIPRPQAVTFSGPLPRYWNEARRAVVEPYLRDETGSAELAAELALWYRQRGD
jgi:hypothetical protein